MSCQHFYGVYLLLTGARFSPAHRKFAVLVTNSGRFITVFGMVLSKVDQNYIIGATVVALLLLAASVQKVFFAQGTKVAASATPSNSSGVARQRSPPRDVKRD